MGDEDYKPMGRSVAVNAPRGTLDISRSARAATASFRDSIREVVGSEPILEVSDQTFTLCTYGAGVYKEISRFSLRELPGCCGVIVFYHASVAEDFRGKGLGSLLLRLREEAARKAGYTVAMATVLKSNDAERSILKKGGWEEIDSFKNLRTNNNVLILTKTLS